MNTQTSYQGRNDARIAEQAAEWLAVLQRGTDEDNKAFAAWLLESRRHVEEFLFASALERTLDGVDREKKLDVDGILAAAGVNVVQMRPRLSPAPSDSTDRRGRWKRWGVGIAAGIAVALIATGVLLQSFGWENYYTTLGEQRAVELSDGSVIHLNTQSRLQVHFTRTGRELRLLEGEAMFNVKRDPLRPFTVDAGGTAVQVVGTRFNIHLANDATTISVIEGAVKVADDEQILAAGQQARVGQKKKAIEHAALDIERVTAWRQRRLMFRADTLADIAAEFNRYNRAPQIRVEGNDVRSRRFTGIFNADDPESLAEFLAQQYPDLAIEQEPSAIHIRRAADK